MEQYAHVARMVDGAELRFDHPGDHGRGPDSGVQPISHRPAVQDVAQAAALRFRQPRRPPGPVTLQEALDAMSLIPSQPLGYLGARRLQNSCQIAARSAFGIQEYRLQAFRHAVRTLLLRLLTQSDQPAISLGMQPQQARKHGHSSCEKYAIWKQRMSL